jgi:hypothetical protein
MWHPLPLAALNTPPERASARVFLNVLRDSLARAPQRLRHAGPEGGPECPAARRGRPLRGAARRRGAQAPRWTPCWLPPDGRWQVDDAGTYDGVVALVRAGASLLQGVQDARLDEVLARLQAFTPEAITTCYLQYDAAVRLDAVLRPRRCAGAALGPVRLRPGPAGRPSAGLLAVVISASGTAAGRATDRWRKPSPPAGAGLAPAGLAQPAWSQLITEKRATFACTPDPRPGNASGVPACCWPATHGRRRPRAGLPGHHRSGRAQRRGGSPAMRAGATAK